MTLHRLETVGDNACTDLLLLSNFSGLPSITIPALDRNPEFCGLNINCNWFNDQKLLNLALTIEELNQEFDINKNY